MSTAEKSLLACTFQSNERSTIRMKKVSEGRECQTAYDASSFSVTTICTQRNKKYSVWRVFFLGDDNLHREEQKVQRMARHLSR